jgi:hypothetical protein
VVHKGEERTVYRVLVNKSQNERDPEEDKDIGRWITLR